MTFNRGCVNPKSRNFGCALDSSAQPHGKDLENYKVVKVRGNRAYLCRWAMKPELEMQEEMRQVFGITTQTSTDTGADTDADTDLYEVAGCLLRLAIWPTELLWRELDSWLDSQGFSTLYPDLHPPSSSSSSSLAVSVGSSYSSDTQNENTTVTKDKDKAGKVKDGKVKAKAKGSQPGIRQVGLHFRCGDSSFTVPTENGAAAAAETEKETQVQQKQKHNPECWYDDSQTVPWKGTAFYDDLSLDSPVDEANCARTILENINKSTNTNTSISTNANNDVNGNQKKEPRALVYIASDNGDSALQMNRTLRWPNSIVPLESCHVDLHASNSHNAHNQGATPVPITGSGHHSSANTHTTHGHQKSSASLCR